MFLHVLGHIDTDQGILVTEHDLSQCFCQFRLTNTGSTEEDEGTGRALRIFQTETASSDRLGDRRDSLILTDNTFLEFFFKSLQTLRVTLGDLLDRDTCPAGHDVCNIIRCECQFFLRADDLLTECAEFLLEDSLFIPEFLCRFKVLIIYGFLLQSHDLIDTFTDLLCFIRFSGRIDTKSRCRLIDQVDRLIRQETVSDITAAENNCRIDRIVRDLDAVMLFELAADTL